MSKTFLYIRFSEARPVYDLAPGLRTGLVLFSSFVMAFATVFYNTVHIYSSEVEVTSLEQENKQLEEDLKKMDEKSRYSMADDFENIVPGEDMVYGIPASGDDPDSDG